MMHEIMMKLEEIRQLKNTLLDAVKAEVAKGVQCVDTKEAGEVVDMIKDLAEAEKCCMEACYYTKIVEAMDEAGEEDIYGYNNRRYSNGRYAPRGRGRVMGFSPTMMQMPYMEDYLTSDTQDSDFRMEYSGGNRSQSGSRGSYGGGSNSGGRMGYSYGYDDRYGMPYRQWQDSRRFYTETHSADAKRDMDTYASEHVGDTIASIREIWKDADPTMRRKLKEDFSKLVKEMEV